MIALVRIALSRPYTFVVLALLLLIIGPLAALRTLLCEEDVSSSVVQMMATRGLIRTPEHPTQHFFFGWPCARA